MASTKQLPNLKLETYNSSPLAKQATFEEFRLAMADSDKSNMTKIDDFALEVRTELGKRATKDVATTSANGLMSSTDKTRIDGMWAGQAGNTDILAHNTNPDAHPDKLQLNGVATNVNFKRNEIVQDGLIKSLLGNVPVKTNTTIVALENAIYTLSFRVHENNGDILYYLCGNQDPNTPIKGFYIKHETSGRFKITDIGGTNTVSSEVIKKSAYNVCVIVENGLKIRLIVDGALVCSTTITRLSTVPITINGSTTGWQSDTPPKIYDFLMYNRQLTSKEIQHNFSVLNNTLAISSIEATDSEGHKTSFLFGTKTDLIETRTGHTEEERYTALLSKFGKKFTSAGEDITVANGIENQRVLSAKISGQTVKCIYADSNWITLSGSTAKWLVNSISLTYAPQLKVSTTYVLLTEIKSNTLTTSFASSYSGATRPFTKPSQTVSAKQTGIFKDVLTTKDSLTDVTELFNSGALHDGNGEASITFRRCLLEITDASLVNSFVPFGLNSTQAVITANNLKYSFYANAEDKAQDKVIDLGGLEGGRNTLEIKEDGSATYVQNTTKQNIATIMKNAILQATAPNQTNTLFFQSVPQTTLKAYTSFDLCLSSSFQTVNPNTLWGQDIEGICVNNRSEFQIRIAKSKLATQDVIGLTTYLTALQSDLIAQLATPVVTTIDKSLVPAILTQLTNTFKFGDAVKPSSVEITVPVDKLAEIESRLTQVTSLLNELAISQ